MTGRVGRHWPEAMMGSFEPDVSYSNSDALLTTQVSAVLEYISESEVTNYEQSKQESRR